MFLPWNILDLAFYTVARETVPKIKAITFVNRNPAYQMSSDIK